MHNSSHARHKEILYAKLKAVRMDGSRSWLSCLLVMTAMFTSTFHAQTPATEREALLEIQVEGGFPNWIRPPLKFQVDIGWDEPPSAISPVINAWHDTPLGASGNPHHDQVYPPSTWDIVEPMDAARSQLRAPYVRLWSDTSYVYDWPGSTRKTVVGPAASPPNTTQTCTLHFPTCACCPQSDCACTATYNGAPVRGVARSTSWDFSALDIQVQHLLGSVAFPETSILQLTGNSPPWWFWAPGQPRKEFAEPTGVREGHYFSRVLDWYQKGGLTDELGMYHHSGHNYTWGYLEVLNEMDYIAGPKYIRWYDGVTKIVKANHPNIKFIGNCHAWQGTADNCSIWRQFLNRSNHAPGTPWPIDAVSFHGYTGVDPGENTVPGGAAMAENLVHGAKGVIRNSQQAARVIKEVSPSTLVFMDEVGILLGCDPPFNATDTLGDGPLSNWWNIQSVVWALFVGDLTAAGVDMVGASQFVGWPAGDVPPECQHDPAGCVGVPGGPPTSWGAKGCPFQSQVSPGGNCPEMSMIDWTNGELNARSWVMKMMIDGLGNAPKKVLVTNVSNHATPPRQECKLLKTVVDTDCRGGDICEFNMSGSPSSYSATCAAACCASTFCSYFVTLAPGHGYVGAGVCDGRPACPVGGACCYLKSHLSAIKSMYPPGDCSLGSVTPSPPDPTNHAVYARAFAPTAGTTLPSSKAAGRKVRGAVLLANLSANQTQSVTFEGLKGARLWSVVHGKSGSWKVPYTESVSAIDTLEMEPLAVYLAFVAAAA